MQHKAHKEFKEEEKEKKVDEGEDEDEVGKNRERNARGATRKRESECLLVEKDRITAVWMMRPCRHSPCEKLARFCRHLGCW